MQIDFTPSCVPNGTAFAGMALGTNKPRRCHIDHWTVEGDWAYVIERQRNGTTEEFYVQRENFQVVSILNEDTQEGCRHC